MPKLLSDLQKQVIDANPDESEYSLAHKVGCHWQTIKAYRVKKQREITTDIVKSEDSVRAHATKNDVVKKTGISQIDESIALTSEQMDAIQSIFIFSEFNQYQQCTKRLEVKPGDYPTIMEQKQHADLLQKGLFLMGKWLGKDKTVVDVNTTLIRKITPEDLENMTLDELLKTVDVCNRNKI